MARLAAAVIVAKAACAAASAESDSKSFVVIKGYHVGSKWFAETFNKLPGGSFFFEYEHCLRTIAKSQHGNASIDGISTHATSSYLHHGCRCQNTCAGCEHHNKSPSLPSQHSNCLATGVSFGALGPTYVAHLQTMLRLEPRIAVVAHVRSNHIKHGISFLRTTCDGELNHLYASDVAKRRDGSSGGTSSGGSGSSSSSSPSSATSGSGSGSDSHKLHMPPALLLLKASNAAAEQSKIVKAAQSLSRGHGAVHVVMYEAMQRDLVGEMQRLLIAVGVPSAAASAAAATLDAQQQQQTQAQASSAAAEAVVKAGAENARDALSNYEEVASYLRPLSGCLHAMLGAQGPVVFELGACATELDSLLVGKPKVELAAVREARPKLKLTATECGGST